MLVGMYIFELIYRVKVSHISSMHHIGTIMVAESAIAISLNLTREKDASIEFILCTVWGESLPLCIPSPAIPIQAMVKSSRDAATDDWTIGAFDIVCELLPHIAIVLYRLYPTRHTFLSRLFLFASISTFIGTVCETLVIFYLFGSLWPEWQLAFKIVTPVLHIAFSATQLHGSRVFWRMWRRQRGIIEGLELGGRVEEGGLPAGAEGPAGGDVYGSGKEGKVLDDTDAGLVGVRELQSGDIV